MKRRPVLALALALAAAFALPAAAQQDKPIRVIVPYPAGGNADNIARLYAEALGKKLGRAVIVDNKPGAGGVIGAQAAMRGANDGSVLFVAPTGVFVVTPHLQQLPYDPLTDFVPVARLTTWIPMMVVRKDFPGNNFAEVVAEMKKHPGKYSFGSAGPATMTHLMGELINLKTGVNTVHVPYKGSAEFIPDLLSGRVDVVYDSVVVPQVKAGQLKAIASMVGTRHPDLPNVPTLKELGVDLDVPNWYGVFAPKGTPANIVDQIGAASKDVMEGIDKSKLTAMSMSGAFEGPADFKAQIAKDDALMKDVIQKANIHIN
ncbi:Bug family tripartite tricarboxylate transporter substrate binding protein [Variovorax sp. PBL-E5]|uniref:Bug family tripartite tricarboxylate transporter substrate binding protein n=1 Tax=Variovorax sp. PBL-E5 TaxID=434014 RepID=UPI001317D853|nr:tripartite tricarboxylate transporter substrate binding protein [Variovorax sp. PBL-E5]VTU16247.1 Argininosuccinate lyase [Variovorax sp. PBL-E5]